MKLRKIKAFGFKTFADAITLDFAGGITGIVGPNGSGKSNIVDAFRWVLGETSTRSLRSDKLEGVIFAGTDKRKPLGLAEVSLTFDNTDGRLATDFREVEITRRTYRAGESEYFINRSQVRLRDIHDLLMGTGLGPGSYSIVSQGQIDAILTSKPAERRALFEETAGINKFLARKNESLRQLEKTEQNAIRINDLIAEIEKRIPELETQVRRAKRYRKVQARVRDLEILSYLRASASRREERARLADESARIEERRGNAAASAASLGGLFSEVRNRLYQADLALEDLRVNAQERRAELARVEADYAAALARREALEAQSTQTSADVERVVREREELGATIERLEREIEPLVIELEAARERELAAQATLAQARAQLDAIFTRLREVEADVAREATARAERRAQGESLRGEIARLEGEIAEDAGRLGELERSVDESTHRCAQHESVLAQAEEQQREARGAVESAQAVHAQAQSAAAAATAALREHAGEVKAAESRLHTIEELENSLEGHVPGTRAVMEAKQRGELGGIEGIVSNLITTDEKYARAMDIAFGARLSNIVTTSSEDAERGIEFLNAREAGRATFLPLDTLTARDARTMTQELSAIPGVIDYAHRLVRTDARYEGVVRFLVGNVLVVDTLQTGIHLVRERKLRETIVTLGGEQITGGGAITGGRFQRERSLLSRRVAAQTLRGQLDAMHATLRRLEAEASACAERITVAARALDQAREASNACDVHVTELRGELTALGATLERTNAEVGAVRAHIDERRGALAVARERALALGDETASKASGDEERERLEAELAQARAGIARSEEQQREATQVAAALRERNAALHAERDAAAARLGMLDQNQERARDARERMLAEIGTLAEETRRLHAHAEGLRAGVAEIDARLENARREREQLAARQSQLEGELKQAEFEEREASHEGERVRTRLAEIDAELGMLVAQFAQNPAGDDECADVATRYADESDEVVEDLPRLRDELARLSANVNLNAEAESEELAERDRELRKQLEDVMKARETLLESIREIEKQTQVRFNETFEKVAEAFTESFDRLFPGGQAKMWQTNPENISETGIEISAQPPGKKAMPLAALSGGERAMVAAALIFALIKVKPSPFYLLDEIDAALDDANVERLSQMVRDLQGDSQMIVVTHNRKTMEIADRLYGVSMSEPGVSSIISAELTPDPELALA